MITTLILLLGFVLIVGGVAAFSPAVGAVVAGVLCVALALGEKQAATKREAK